MNDLTNDMFKEIIDYLDIISIIELSYCCKNFRNKILTYKKQIKTRLHELGFDVEKYSHVRNILLNKQVFLQSDNNNKSLTSTILTNLISIKNVVPLVITLSNRGVTLWKLETDCIFHSDGTMEGEISSFMAECLISPNTKLILATIIYKTDESLIYNSDKPLCKRASLLTELKIDKKYTNILSSMLSYFENNEIHFPVIDMGTVLQNNKSEIYPFQSDIKFHSSGSLEYLPNPEWIKYLLEGFIQVYEKEFKIIHQSAQNDQVFHLSIQDYIKQKLKVFV